MAGVAAWAEKVKAVAEWVGGAEEEARLEAVEERARVDSMAEALTGADAATVVDLARGADKATGEGCWVETEEARAVTVAERS